MRHEIALCILERLGQI